MIFFTQYTYIQICIHIYIYNVCCISRVFISKLFNFTSYSMLSQYVTL